jgi:ABC-2 type transport system ATP-binding protein
MVHRTQGNRVEQPLALTNASALSVKGLSKSFGHLKALNSVNLEVARGDFLALLGPNGAGKSTLINTIVRLINQDSGTIDIMGISLINNRKEALKKIGLMPQEFNFNIFEQVEQILITQAGYYGISAMQAKRNMESIIEPLALTDKIKSRAGSLSGGMKRRLMLARSLIHDPELLILDEPTAGVDVELRRSLWDFICSWQRNGKTVILTTHYLEEAEQLCKTLAIIQNGRIVKKDSLQRMLDLLGTRFYLIDLEQETEELPQSANFKLEKIEGPTWQISLNRGDNLNLVWSHLLENKIQIKNMRMRASPVEELFMQFAKGELS